MIDTVVLQVVPPHRRSPLSHLLLCLLHLCLLNLVRPHPALEYSIVLSYFQHIIFISNFTLLIIITLSLHWYTYSSSTFSSNPSFNLLIIAVANSLDHLFRNCQHVRYLLASKRPHISAPMCTSKAVTAEVNQSRCPRDQSSIE